MKVACWLSHGHGSPQAGAYDGADLSELAWAAEILRRQGRATVTHLTLRNDARVELDEQPPGRETKGLPRMPEREEVGLLLLEGNAALAVEADDVVITLTWDSAKPHLPPQLDYLYGQAPTPGQFYLAAAACEELARTPIRNAIFGQIRQEEERRRQILDLHSGPRPPGRAG